MLSEEDLDEAFYIDASGVRGGSLEHMLYTGQISPKDYADMMCIPSDESTE